MMSVGMQPNVIDYSTGIVTVIEIFNLVVVVNVGTGIMLALFYDFRPS